MIYGNLPRDLGPIDITPTEMMFWMYCPIKVPRDTATVLPRQLEGFRPIVEDAMQDFRMVCLDLGGMDGLRRLATAHYYITAKTLWVSGDYIGNRPGWHSDGFGTDDLNYIWCDRAPTEFIQTEVELSTDCEQSMIEMEELGNNEAYWGNLITYPDKHLLRLDPSVIHRSPASFDAGMRTFVKVSISRHRYDLIGNSINNDLPASHWPLVERAETRNHPSSENK